MNTRGEQVVEVPPSVVWADLPLTERILAFLKSQGGTVQFTELRPLTQNLPGANGASSRPEDLIFDAVELLIAKEKVNEERSRIWLVDS